MKDWKTSACSVVFALAFSVAQLPDGLVPQGVKTTAMIVSGAATALGFHLASDSKKG